MLKKDFIKFADQGNSRVSINKIIKDFNGSPLQTYKTLNNKNSFLFVPGTIQGYGSIARYAPQQSSHTLTTVRSK